MRAKHKHTLISSRTSTTAIILSVAILSAAMPAKAYGRSSLVEDRAAQKLLQAGDARYEANELKQVEGGEKPDGTPTV